MILLLASPISFSSILRCQMDGAAVEAAPPSRSSSPVSSTAVASVMTGEAPPDEVRTFMPLPRFAQYVTIIGYHPIDQCNRRLSAGLD